MGDTGVAGRRKLRDCRSRSESALEFEHVPAFLAVRSRRQRSKLAKVDASSPTRSSSTSRIRWLRATAVAARQKVRELLEPGHSVNANYQLWVRINASRRLGPVDLAAVVGGAPDGIVLPKIQGPATSSASSHHLRFAGSPRRHRARTDQDLSCRHRDACGRRFGSPEFARSTLPVWSGSTGAPKTSARRSPPRPTLGRTANGR